MNDPIQHLPGIAAAPLRTARLDTYALTSGPTDGEPVLLLHGNLSTSTFWEETMLALPERFRAVAVDQRGYGLADPRIRIDARRGVADWAEDALAVADQLGWDRFHVVAHSLGGCVAWGLLSLAPRRIASATLAAPGPPCGFGGARGLRGELNHEDGAGSGAALVHGRLAERLQAGDRTVEDALFSPRVVMNRLYWKPPFRPAREEQLLTAMLAVHLGDQAYPGDWRVSPHWPGFAPGVHGPINALSPLYNQGVLQRLIEIEPRPRLLWVYGEDDAIVSDGSVSDAAVQGKLGLRGDWPGDAVFPPQPLLSQVRYALDQYEQNGGLVQRLILPATGHTPYLERPLEFTRALHDHLLAPELH